MKYIIKITALLLIIVALVSCDNKIAQQNEENTEETSESEESSTMVTLQQKQLEVMNIEVGTAKQLNLGATLKVNGQLELPPQNKASISTIIGGSVQSVAVIEGDFVKKGQVLAKLSSPEFITIQKEYLTAKSNLTFLENDFQRKKVLLKDGITSTKSFQLAESAYFEGKSALNASKSTLKMIGISINSLDKGQIVSSFPVVAPIKGYIQNINVNIGKYVTAQQEMFEIVDNEFLHLGLNVFEKDIDKVNVGQLINFSLTTKPDEIYKAKIFAIGKAFDLDTRAITVHANIIGAHKGLLTGMYVEARIVTSNKNVNALPIEAFVSEKGLSYVFIQKNKNNNTFEFEKIQVNKGISDLGFTEVVFVDDVSKNAIFVIKGAYYLNSEMQKSEFGDDD
jgi:cobalt-zinc-cadmium efflux system membrane fusion protein